MQRDRRVGIFVNVTNQFGALTSNFKKGYRVNYERYLQHFCEGQSLILAIAYGTQVSDEASAFISALKYMGYTTKFAQATMLTRQEILHPNRNVEITVDVMGLYEKLDMVVLGSNDPDLIPLIKFLQMRGVKVVIATPFLAHREGSVNLDILTIPEMVVNIQDMRTKEHAPQKRQKPQGS